MKLEDYKAIEKLIPRAENAFGKTLTNFTESKAAYGDKIMNALSLCRR
jgi:hypothetical protein